MGRVKKPRRPPGFFAERIIMPNSPYLHDDIATEINDACNTLRKSSKGVGKSRTYKKAAFTSYLCRPKGIAPSHSN